jgi:hypothetical protein
MPRAMEKSLKRKAKKKGLTGKGYVYGTMRKTGWKPKKK